MVKILIKNLYMNAVWFFVMLQTLPTKHNDGNKRKKSPFHTIEITE